MDVRADTFVTVFVRDGRARDQREPRLSTAPATIFHQRLGPSELERVVLARSQSAAYDESDL